MRTERGLMDSTKKNDVIQKRERANVDRPVLDVNEIELNMVEAGAQ